MTKDKCPACSEDKEISWTQLHSSDGYTGITVNGAGSITLLLCRKCGCTFIGANDIHKICNARKPVPYYH